MPRVLIILERICTEKFIYLLAIFTVILAFLEFNFLSTSISMDLEILNIILGAFLIASLWLVFLYPLMGIILFLVLTYGVSPEIFGRGGGDTFLVTQGGYTISWAVILTTMVGGLVSMLRNASLKIALPKEAGIVTGFFLAVAVSVALAERRDLAWINLEGIAKLFLLYLMTINLIVTKKDFMVIIWGIAIFSGFLSLESFIKYLRYGSYGESLGDPVRGENNYFALLLVMSLPFVWFLICNQNSLLRKIFGGILFLLMIAIIILTFSRSGFLALTAVLITVLFRSKKFNRVVFSMMTVAVVILLLSWPQYRTRIASILNHQNDASVLTRFYAWEAGIKMLKEYPLTGVGLGNFEHFSTSYCPRLKWPNTAHNSFIQIAGECGLIGLFFFLFLLIYTVYDLERLKKRCRTQDGNKWIISLANAIETSLLAYFISGNFQAEPYFTLLYLILGLAPKLSVCTIFSTDNIHIDSHSRSKRGSGE